jgi:hypothetical protein
LRDFCPAIGGSSGMVPRYVSRIGTGGRGQNGVETNALGGDWN